MEIPVGFLVWSDLSAQAQTVLDRQGVAYADRDGELVTSIVGGKDCVFTCHDGEFCLCTLEKAFREGRSGFCKPVSCALYPIREIRFSDGRIGLNYHRWDVCRDAVKKGRETSTPLYKFLRTPLIRRFGNEWYEELETIAAELKAQGYIKD